MKRLHVRQGDVLLLHCSSLPADAVAVPNKDRIVLAHGEATGHAHAVSCLSAEEFRSADQRFLQVTGFTDLLHEEHSAICLAPGCYKIIRQREYLPNAYRYVYD